MARDYHNEIDPYAAQWVRNLIAEGLLPPGDVDERSIVDVQPEDLDGYTRCHFFAGLGGWPFALRLAGWPDDRPVWTGSCPCQPFSVSGKRKGFADERHLWPVFQRLIQVGRPPVLFGEQVARAPDWLRLVRGDLVEMGYAVGAIPMEAASADADHFRDRYWFVADRKSFGRWAGFREGQPVEHRAEPTDDSRQHSALVNHPGLGWGEGWTEHELRSRGFSAAVASIDGRQYLECPDGKWRRLPPPGVRWMGNGLSASLVAMRTIQNRACEEVTQYAASCQRDPHEVLRMVQSAIQPEENWEKYADGVRFKLHETQILLRFLCCVDAALGPSKNHRGIAKALNENELRVVRGMWGDEGDGSPPHRWEPPEQCEGKSPDSLLALSLLLARLAKAHRDKAISAHAISDRVAKLRAIGNAIDTRPAAEFIRAYLDCRP